MDFSQVTLSSIVTQMGNNVNLSIDESMCRHMVLNSIRSYKTKFSDEYGEFIIATDNKNYWRKKLFPYYKANRKKSQTASELDWKAIFECLNKIRGELKEYFPYRVIDVESAEADDIIGTLCIEYGNTEKILILSGDHDFQQLQTKNVLQYNPVMKKYITCNDPDKYLKEHILKGDTGDGIPNVLSDDNSLVLGIRQKPMTQKRLDELSVVDSNHPAYRNYVRNKALIDLKEIPIHISEQILESYNQQANKKPKNLLQYFINNRLRNLTESIADFV